MKYKHLLHVTIGIFIDENDLNIIFKKIFTAPFLVRSFLSAGHHLFISMVQGSNILCPLPDALFCGFRLKTVWMRL